MKRKFKTVTVEQLEITGVEFQGKGVARHNGKVIFVEQAVPGDVVDVRLTKSKKDFAVGTVINFHKYSEERQQPFCEHFGICGGCKWQSLPYEKQLHYKHSFVVDAITKIGKLNDVPILPIIGCEQQTFFRNKLEYTFSDSSWLTQEQLDSDEIFEQRNALGFHVPGRFDKVVHVEKCWLQNDLSNEIRNFAARYANENKLPFFNIRAQTGLLRNLIIRTATTGENMVVLVVKENDEAAIHGIMEQLKNNFPQITSLNYVVNSGANDMIHAFEVICYHGKPFIIEQLGDLKFKVGPKSFFQTNTLQAKKLYDIALEFTDLKGTENVYDLYTGIGSIALYAANKCKSVAAIEQIPDAIADAKENAELNNISNCTFYVGDVKDMFNEDFYSKHGAPDVVITDPPRVGMHGDVVKTLLNMPVPKIVYVSCNPTTQARDLQLLSEKYTIEKIQPVDMFPQTYHIESVALLTLKQ
jgi:23S rRNA (uracil1939-C5)-methyltransferase